MNTLLIVVVGAIIGWRVVDFLLILRAEHKYQEECQKDQEERQKDVVAWLLKRYSDDEKTQQQIKTIFGNIAKEKKQLELEIEKKKKQYDEVCSSYRDNLLDLKPDGTDSLSPLDLRVAGVRRDEFNYEYKALKELEDCWVEFFETQDKSILTEKLPNLRRNWYFYKLCRQDADMETIKAAQDGWLKIPTDF